MKFLIIFLSTLTLSLSTQAQDFVDIDGLNANIFKGAGNGKTELFAIGAKAYSLKYKGEFDITIQEKNLLLGFKDVDLEVKNLPSFITNAEKLIIKDLNIQYKKLKSGSIDFNEARIDSDLVLKQMVLTCGKIGRFRFQDIIELCSHQASVKGNYVLIKGKNSNNRFTNIFVKIENKKFYVRTNWKIGILKGKLKTTGETAYIKDKDSAVLRIKINTAHLGIIPIKNTLFSILRKNQSKKFKVKKPYLFISL